MFSTLSSLDGSRTYSASETRYRDEHGGLLEVRHDLAKLREACPDLRERFDARRQSWAPEDVSGVWRYRELILPDLPVADIVTKPEGNTNLYHSEVLGERWQMPQLYLKHEGENPTLSFKDRGMTAGVSWAKHVGATYVACASTGDTSAAMAAYAAQVPGMRGVVFLPRGKVSLEQLSQPLCYGAQVLALDTDFDGCMRLVQEFTARSPVYLLNSMNSFRIEGQKAIGIEAVHQLGWEVPDWFVIPVGNAGNLSALGKGLRELYALGLIDRLPRIAGAQAEPANPFYQSYKQGFSEQVSITAGDTVASAIRIGDPVSYPKARSVIETFNGTVVSVTEAETMDTKAIVDAAGVHICPNSAVAVAGVRKLVGEGAIKPHEKVVVILTAHGNKFSQTSIDYHGGALAGVDPAHGNPPIHLPASLEAIVEALEV